MIRVWLHFLSSLVYFSKVGHLVDGLTPDDLDLARSAIKSAVKSITLKPTTKSIKNTHGIIGLKGWVVPVVTSTGDVKEKEVTTINKFNTTKPKNLNKFNEAIDQIERGMVHAVLSRKKTDLTDLRKDVTDAVNRGNVRFARRALGIALFTANEESKHRGKRSSDYTVETFVDGIKKDLGDEKFSDFLALQGEVTLMFALDVTGSMREEIRASKEIIKAISKLDRSEPVDYILTTFSDPIGLTTAAYYADDQVNQLVSHVDGINVKDGGDCPEFTFDGMISALFQDPRWGSPLYVFTDASPKDADGDSKEVLRVLAEDLGVTVNFFVSRNPCGDEDQQQPFKDVVEAHGGLYLRLDSNELTKMASLTSISLEGTAAVACGKGKTGRRKRRSTIKIGIQIDDTVTQLIVTVTTDSSPHGIQLNTPTGQLQTTGKTVLSKVIIFIVNNTVKGLWNLMVPSSVGKYDYSAKVSSPENIDFEHFFSKMERRKMVNLRNPLAGQSSKVTITVSGASKIQISSLLIDIIDIAGNTLIANKKPMIAGKGGVIFTLDLVPPNGAFKLLLKGKTNGGKNFQRISRHVDSAKPLVVKEYYTLRHYTIPQNGNTTILFYLFNGLSSSKMYAISLKTREGYTAFLHGSQALASRMNVRGRSKKYLRLTVGYNGGISGSIGETLNVIIIVKGRDKSFVTAEVVPLIII